LWDLLKVLGLPSVPDDTAEHNRVHLMWVLGHKGTDDNEIVDQLAEMSYLHTLTGLESACCISESVVRQAFRD
jgi:hypothetical protein